MLSIRSLNILLGVTMLTSLSSCGVLNRFTGSSEEAASAGEVAAIEASTDFSDVQVTPRLKTGHARTTGDASLYLDPADARPLVILGPSTEVQIRSIANEDWVVVSTRNGYSGYLKGDVLENALEPVRSVVTVKPSAPASRSRRSAPVTKPRVEASPVPREKAESQEAVRAVPAATPPAATRQPAASSPAPSVSPSASPSRPAVTPKLLEPDLTPASVPAFRLDEP